MMDEDRLYSLYSDLLSIIREDFYDLIDKKDMYLLEGFGKVWNSIENEKIKLGVVLGKDESYGKQ